MTASVIDRRVLHPHPPTPFAPREGGGHHPDEEIESVYSLRMVSPPLDCQSFTSWSKSDSGRRPTTMSVRPSVMVWFKLKPLVKLVSDTWPNVGFDTATGTTAFSAALIVAA